MSTKFVLEKVPYFSQRDNVVDPFISCFPTSVAMSIQYILDINSLDRTAIGCDDPNCQLEDYINRTLDSKEVDDWMKENTTRLGSWIWNYKKRTIYAVEEYVCNLLLNHLGYKATFTECMPYDKLCAAIETNQLPAIIGGNFRSISSVGGHMNCMIGFNNIGLKQVRTNDPYGNALTNYKSTNGKNMIYDSKIFCDSRNTVKTIIFERM